MDESTDPHTLRPGEAGRLLAGHPWRRFAVIGDSVAEGIGDLVDGYSPLSWCDRIADELKQINPDLVYLNLGKGGLKAAEVRADQLERAVAFQPDLAIVVCGGNDAFSRGYNPDHVDSELAVMVLALQGMGADVITLSMLDVSHSPAVPDRIKPGLADRMATLAARSKALSEELESIHVYLYDHPAVADLSLYSADGLHGNRRSDAIAAAEVIRRLGVHLGQ